MGGRTNKRCFCKRNSKLSLVYFSNKSLVSPQISICSMDASCHLAYYLYPSACFLPANHVFACAEFQASLPSAGGAIFSAVCGSEVPWPYLPSCQSKRKHCGCLNCCGSLLGIGPLHWCGASFVCYWQFFHSSMDQGVGRCILLPICSIFWGICTV